MIRNIPQRYLLIIAVIILIGLILSFSNQAPNSNQTNTNNSSSPPMAGNKIYADNGIYFEYPPTWNLTLSETTNNMTTIFVKDANALNSNSTIGAEFIVLKTNKIANRSIDDLRNSVAEGMNLTNRKVSNTTNITLSGKTARQMLVNGTDNRNIFFEANIISLEDNGIYYILELIVFGQNYRNQQSNFDLILRTFKIQ